MCGTRATLAVLLLVVNWQTDIMVSGDGLEKGPVSATGLGGVSTLNMLELSREGGARLAPEEKTL